MKAIVVKDRVAAVISDDGTVIGTVDFDALPPAGREWVIRYGMTQLLADAWASAKTEEARAEKARVRIAKLRGAGHAGADNAAVAAAVAKLREQLG